MSEPTPVLRVTTENGSVYDFSEGLWQVRRSAGSESVGLRRDGEWVECVGCEVAIGYPLVIYLKLVDGAMTCRRASKIVSIEGIN